MSQMPDSVYLHRYTKYQTTGIYSAFSENYLLSENDFDDKCLEDYVEYTPVYRLEESERHVKEQMIEKAAEWLSKQAYSRPMFWSIEDFKKAMKGE